MRTLIGSVTLLTVGVMSCGCSTRCILRPLCDPLYPVSSPLDELLIQRHDAHNPFMGGFQTPFMTSLKDRARYYPEVFQTTEEAYRLDGDCALRGTATTITNTIRPGDMASRYGGEEFLIILPDCAVDSALTAAERLREAVSGTVFTNPDGELLPPVTISVGVAEMENDPTVEELIKNADAALYRAKKSGRDCVCV